MYFSKLLHGFSKVVLEISSRLNFDLDLKACWSFCFGKKIQGRPLHPNTLGLSNWPFKCKDCIACYISKIIINTEWDIQYSQQNKVEKYKALKLPLFIWDGLNVFKSISTTIPTKSLLSNFHSTTERHRIICNTSYCCVDVNLHLIKKFLVTHVPSQLGFEKWWTKLENQWGPRHSHLGKQQFSTFDVFPTSQLDAQGNHYSLSESICS